MSSIVFLNINLLIICKSYGLATVLLNQIMKNRGFSPGNLDNST